MTDTARANMSSVDATRSALEAAYDALKAFPDGQEPSGTAKLILEAVEDVLCEEGAEQFSMPSVAASKSDVRVVPSRDATVSSSARIICWPEAT